MLQKELPRGWVAYLILIYSVVGILALLLVHPLKEISQKSWVKIFSKFFYYTLAPLLILLYVAIFTRILEYGYTEPRYFVLLLAFWLTAVVIYSIILPKKTIKFIPVSLFAFGIFAMIFPYFNAFSVAKRSQKHELETLIKNHRDSESKLNFNARISATDADRIANLFRFLAERKEQKVLENTLPPEKQQLMVEAKSSGDYHQLYTNIRNSFSTVEDRDNAGVAKHLNLASTAKFHSASGFDYVLSSSVMYSGKPVILEGAQFRVETEQKDKLLALSIDGTEWDMTPFIKSELAKQQGKAGTVHVPEISMERTVAGFQIKVIFSNLSKDAGDESPIYFEPPLILIKKR